MNQGNWETSCSTNSAFAHARRELEAMSEASNYQRWILRIFAPYLGRHLVEVGAGPGSFSELVLSHHDCETLGLVEPSGEMDKQLDARAHGMPSSPRVDTYHASFPEAAPLIKAKHSVDWLFTATCWSTLLMMFYDRYIVPAVRHFEAVIHPPIGKNVIVVAEKG